jgi:NADH:ubiquinone oxidoreductase subunit 6 (subunit J)
MNKKIINIIVFVIAGIGCLLSLWFSVSFDDNKKDLYNEINNIRKNNTQMVTDLEALTPASLSGFVSTKIEEHKTLSTALKAKQLQKDIFYTYIVELKDLDEDGFANYKAQFPKNVTALFAQSELKDEFVTGFDRVSDYASLHSYILSLENKYDVLKQDYLKEKSYVRAFGNLLKRVGDINNVVSESKKATDLSTLQSSAKSFIKDGSILNLSITFVYIIFFTAIVSVLVFSILGVVSSIKSSYQILLWVLLLVLIFVIGYFVSSSELSKSAIAMGHTVGEVKWIGAGILTAYMLLFSALLSIIVSPFINKIKKV